MKKYLKIIAVIALISTVLVLLSACSLFPDGTTDTTDTTQTTSTDTDTGTTTEDTTPSPTYYTLSFAGDCTLGTEYASYGSYGSFVQVVGENYAYPLSDTLQYFGSDDFTLVNLEVVLTEHNVPVEKTYRFRAPPAYAKILTEGGVEAVNISNNHSRDYGETGYADTKTALEAENIAYVEKDSSMMFTTESGLVIGVYAAQFYVDISDMQKDIAKLREDGAEIVIFSCHWGIEGSYRPNSDQIRYAHAAIDAGADIVFGHHPHVLQPIEEYNGGVIYYSLGNFSFGGNRNPSDKDTAVIQQEVIREIDGTVHLGETKIIPYRLCSPDTANDYKPTPYEQDSPRYEIVLAKLNGTYAVSSSGGSTTGKTDTSDTTDTGDTTDTTSDTAGTTDTTDTTTDTSDMSDSTDTTDTGSTADTTIDTADSDVSSGSTDVSDTTA